MSLVLSHGVIQLVSIQTFDNAIFPAVYGATKCFVYSFTESMRTEMHPDVRFAGMYQFVSFFLKETFASGKYEL